jgi:hypothetical protein
VLFLFKVLNLAPVYCDAEMEVMIARAYSGYFLLKIVIL